MTSLDPRAEITKIEEDIRQLESLMGQGVMPAELANSSIAALTEKLAAYQAKLEGEGAIAQGSGAKAIGREGILIEGNVYIGSVSKEASPADASPAPGEAPFKGLHYFNVADAPLFFGRTNLTNTLLEHIRTQRFLAVVGASGSGKSSVVRAGVVANLQSQPVWRILIVTPTSQPLETLALALTSDSESVSAAKTLREDMRSDPESLRLYAQRLMAYDSKARGLLVVDQFEELFTLCRDAIERETYINNLMTAVSDERQGPLTIIITLRADFYHHCMQYEELRVALEKHQKTIGAMTTDELCEAIVGPAKKGGWEFESRLVDLMLRDVSDEPGALPLLSHALLATWLQRHNRTLTLAGYSESGGVHGAIAKTAEDTYRHLTADQQPIARSIFLRLTELGEDTPDTRRRVSLRELVQSSGDRESVESVLKVLADARLVTTSQDSVEVAHEALIREWPTLRLWLEEDRAALRVHRHLAETAQSWERNGKDTGDLYRGARLAQVLEWAKIYATEMNPLERQFLKACRIEQGRVQRATLLRLVSILVITAIGFVAVVLALTGQLNRFIYHPLPMEWVEISAGEFTMGSENGEEAEKPVHKVYEDAFQLGIYEVTVEQYNQCVLARVCTAPASQADISDEDLRRPVVNVNWYQAQTFCSWTDPAGRLPTEAEWEKAARGVDKRTYPWGEGIDKTLANYGSTDAGRTLVGSYELGKSPYGVYDMAGNVWEWVADRYNLSSPSYDTSSSSNPLGAESGSYRVLRGGSWYTAGFDIRSSHREYLVPSFANSDLGFRCARDVSPSIP